MKIIKAVDKKVGDTIYYKYKINLPKGVVEKSEFEGQKLKISLKKGKIIIERESVSYNNS